MITNQLAALGKTVASIDSHIEFLNDENEILRQFVASSSSLLAIEVKAKELGFIEPTVASYIPLGTDLPIALSQAQ